MAETRKFSLLSSSSPVHRMISDDELLERYHRDYMSGVPSPFPSSKEKAQFLCALTWWSAVQDWSDCVVGTQRELVGALFHTNTSPCVPLASVPFAVPATCLPPSPPPYSPAIECTQFQRAAFTLQVVNCTHRGLPISSLPVPSSSLYRRQTSIRSHCTRK